MRRPARVCTDLQGELDAAVELLIGGAGDFRGYVVDQRSGRANRFKKVFTVPRFAYMRGTEYFLYYVAHELAHMLCGAGGHCPAFYRKFVEVCPGEWQHFEYGYKPRLARRNGVAGPPKGGVKR